MNRSNFIEKFVDELDFERLLGLADVFRVSHDEEFWIDEGGERSQDWIREEDDLRMRLVNKMKKFAIQGRI